MEEAGLVGREDGAVGGLVMALRLGGRGGQGGHIALLAAGDELGVAEALVVAAVPEELDGVLEEQGQVGLGNAGLLGEALPVSLAAFVQSNDEVVNGLGLR